jgi:glyoxylase-like metal-dependent hydrolase (beta-lactamase superfamily II)
LSISQCLRRAINSAEPTFNDGTTLRQDEVSLELLALPRHFNGVVAVYVPEERVLIAATHR